MLSGRPGLAWRRGAIEKPDGRSGEGSWSISTAMRGPRRWMRGRWRSAGRARALVGVGGLPLPKKLLILALAVTACALAAVGCSKSADEETTATNRPDPA